MIKLSSFPKEVDLHKGEFCVDVSTYSPVKYEKKPVKVCDSTFVKNCKDRSEQVCSMIIVIDKDQKTNVCVTRQQYE